ncbi:7052_t:CDS:2 [Paraglomus brasilianum]|uniref:7052_t:CDS:1 n=1 Tax=Paraglomus brasilianum TaxID=144538 RepID=A0A9N8YX65_9GLOM|nr:7052_t:CDS:2 [Paraglomus brasilianum]
MSQPTQQQSQQSQQFPRDSRIIQLICDSLGVRDHEPKVVQQLLEFAHRYTIDVLQDALIYAEHAGRTDINVNDVKLAIKGRVNYSFTAPPRRDFIYELAKAQNGVPLPPVPERYGLRLPHEKYCLTAVNFQIVPPESKTVVRPLPAVPIAPPPPPTQDEESGIPLGLQEGVNDADKDTEMPDVVNTPISSAASPQKAPRTAHKIEATMHSNKALFNI